MAVTQINELAVTGTSAGSAWFVMDKEVSPGVYQTQKIAGENIGGNLFSQALTLDANREHEMNGFGLTFLKSNFEFRATDGLSANRMFGFRNHTNLAWYFEARNDGSIIHNGSIVQNNDTGSQSFLTNITSNFTTGFEARMFGSGGNGFVVQRLGGANAVGINFTGNRGGHGASIMGMIAQYNVDGAVYSYDTDTYTQYADDIVAGNSAPHFRTENGNVIKLYQQSSAGITTVGDIVTVLQNLGLLS